MERDKAPEFDPGRPLRSGWAVIRAVLFSPRAFYLNFSASGPVREPAAFVALVSAATAVLSVVLAVIFGLALGEFALGELGSAALRAVLFVLLAPLAVGAVAGVYLLAIKAFTGESSGFREVYRMLAYAYAAMILGWVPVLNAFAFTYALMVLMILAIRGVYGTSTLTAIITALVAYVPVAVGVIYLYGTVVRLFTG